MRWLAVASALAGILCLLLALSSCSSNRTQQTKTVEREELVAGPLVIDTPMGQVTVQPTRVMRQRTQDEVTREERRTDLPPVGAIITAAASGTPWGGILAGIVGLATTAFAGKKALDAGRQRNELIAGIERAKDDLGDKWDVLTGHLEAEQNADTKVVVKARTA